MKNIKAGLAGFFCDFHKSMFNDCNIYHFYWANKRGKQELTASA